MQVKDSRIGRRAPSGRITSHPSRYVTGEVFNKLSNSAPTIYWLNTEYFVLLPIGMGSLKPEIVAEFNAMIGIEDVKSKADQNNDDKTEQSTPTSNQTIVEPKVSKRVVVVSNRRTTHQKGNS